MKAKQKYGSTSVLAGMTRIEMLIALYDRTIMHCESLDRDCQSGNQSGATFHEFKAQKMICGIHAGIDQDGSELADNLNRILEFCQSQIAKRQPEAAIRSLRILRDAWEQIADEANQLESSGVIPSIVTTGSSVEVMV
jgi:flagellin-specific chaperone FliS